MAPDAGTLAQQAPLRPARSPGVLLGLGLGAFVDGIVLHQLLQWHHMVSATPGRRPTSLDRLEVNTVADGLFHSAAWVLVLAGVLAMLRAWRQGRPFGTWRQQVGLLLLGWGAFDLLDGVVNHHVLGVHHVRDDLGGPLSWDIGFLVLGALLVAVGWALQRQHGD